MSNPARSKSAAYAAGFAALALIVVFGRTTLTPTAADAVESRPADAAAVAETSGFAVVELFTSEGCSSCPPADSLLAEIDRWAANKGAPVYALSFHVDYWNRLGWPDPYSSRQHTRRQQDYAAASGAERVYTPQMIVNGTEEFVGSNSRLARAAIEAALDQASDARLTLDSVDDGADVVSVAYSSRNAPGGGVLNVALIQTRGEQEVKRGENAGRRLGHVNIVRAFRSVALDASGGGEVWVEKPEGLVGPYEVVAYLQQNDTKRVVAAASTVPAS